MLKYVVTYLCGKVIWDDNMTLFSSENIQVILDFSVVRLASLRHSEVYIRGRVWLNLSQYYLLPN